MCNRCQEELDCRVVSSGHSGYIRTDLAVFRLITLPKYPSLLCGQDEARAKQLTAQLECSSRALATARQALVDETTEARAAQVRLACIDAPPRPFRVPVFHIQLRAAVKMRRLTSV